MRRRRAKKNPLGRTGSVDLRGLETEEELLEALEADPKGVRQALQKLVDDKVERGLSFTHHEERDWWLPRLMGVARDSIDEIIALLPDDAKSVVEDLPRSLVESVIIYDLEMDAGIFEMRSERRRLAYQESVELGATQMEAQAFLNDEPLIWLPSDVALELLNNSFVGDGEWMEIGENIYSSGWIDGETMFAVVSSPGQALEWATDMRAQYVSDLVGKDPDAAISTLLSTIGKLDTQLVKKIKKAKFPKDVLLDLAVAYFQDPEEGLEYLREAVGQFGYEGSRGFVILEIDRAALQAMGIERGGRWWDGAPWSLVDLPVNELAYEGTLMRHCVGRHDMGYQDAVEDGRTQIWSLRSRHNKPILTFEINTRRWEGRGDPQDRGEAIRQLKGKLNRLAGEDEDEARVLSWIFAKLGVDPEYVDDYVPGRHPPSRQNPGFNAPWQPYSRRGSSSRRASLRRKLMR